MIRHQFCTLFNLNLMIRKEADQKLISDFIDVSFRSVLPVRRDFINISYKCILAAFRAALRARNVWS